MLDDNIKRMINGSWNFVEGKISYEEKMKRLREGTVQNVLAYETDVIHTIITDMNEILAERGVVLQYSSRKGILQKEEAFINGRITVVMEDGRIKQFFDFMLCAHIKSPTHLYIKLPGKKFVKGKSIKGYIEYNIARIVNQAFKYYAKYKSMELRKTRISEKV